jgi:hypothetical protein
MPTESRWALPTLQFLMLLSTGFSIRSPDSPPDYPPTVPLPKGEARGINVYL